MLKNLTTIALLLILPVVTIHAQINRKNPGTEEFESFKRNKLYVVLPGPKQLDSALVNTFTKYWTVTPIAGYISRKQMEKRLRDTAFSYFFYREWPKRVYGDKYYSINGFYIINGGKRSLAKYDPFTNFSNVVFAAMLDANEYKREYSIYRLPLMIHAINTFFSTGETIESVPHALDNKILVFHQNHIEGGKKWYKCINSEALSVYKHKYEILPEEKIENLIKTKDSRYALAVPVWNLNERTLYVYDLGTMNIIGVHSPRVKPRVRQWIGEAAFMYLNDCLPEN